MGSAWKLAFVGPKSASVDSGVPGPALDIGVVIGASPVTGDVVEPDTYVNVPLPGREPARARTRPVVVTFVMEGAVDTVATCESLELD